MKIILFGYGKMGKEIESIAVDRGHEISMVIDKDSPSIELDISQLSDADVAIEFSQPEAAVENIKKCFAAKLPIVVGTTGWYEQYPRVAKLCNEKDGTLLAATNFSIGVNLFFTINQQLAKLMDNYPEYIPLIEETHHTQKLDAPSGTAITIAEDIIKENSHINKWVKEKTSNSNEMPIVSHRVENVPGTHVVKYSSTIDDIELIHTAHNRKGFALGAVIAAEFLQDKIGIFTMQDVLKN